MEEGSETLEEIVFRCDCIGSCSNKKSIDLMESVRGWTWCREVVKRWVGRAEQCYTTEINYRPLRSELW